MKFDRSSAEPMPSSSRSLSPSSSTSSSTNSDDEDAYESSLCGFSIDSNDLVISDSKFGYDLEDCWELESLLSKSSLVDDHLNNCDEGGDEDFDTEPETDFVRAEEMTISFNLGKRQRRLTAKAAEAMSEVSQRKQRRTSMRSPVYPEMEGAKLTKSPVILSPDFSDKQMTDLDIGDRDNEASVCDGSGFVDNQSIGSETSSTNKVQRYRLSPVQTVCGKRSVKVNVCFDDSFFNF